MSYRSLFAAAPALLLLTSIARADDDAAKIEFFEKNVRPVLVKYCYTCHSASTNAKGGLRVDDRAGLLRGGSSGPAVVPGNPEKSLLIQAVNHNGDVSSMPPRKHLSAEELADLTRWIKEGAAWPKAELASSSANPIYDRLRKEHWAWRPLRDARPHAVRDASWPRGDIDRFVRATLEEKGLSPVDDADRTTLLRRVTFDLTGLQPTPDELDAFVNDAAPDAFEKVVERLLASPAFGERWGRHWLDVARYGESTGSGRNVPYPHAWRYRDYVIDAFNRDKPYDRFIREQIAGDLLPATSPGERDEQRIATGFLALGVKDVNQRFEVRFVMDNIDEQIDTVTRSVLALTASCARCHDHKFDPIPTLDYYALAGIFHSTELCAGVRNKMGGSGLDYYDVTKLLTIGEEQPLSPEDLQKTENAKKAVAEAQAEVDALRGKPEASVVDAKGETKLSLARKKVSKLQQQLLALTDPALQGRAALGVREAKAVGDTEIRIRGEAEKLGPIAPRGFLSLLQVPQAPKISAAQSGRLELAEWLTRAENPLTPRVMVNRVWRHLFGRGLVSSVDNFGVTGDAPSHPELLDSLAAQFVRDGWSVKSLIRTIVRSRTYQLSSAAGDAASVDPGNRLLWRHSPRRLDAEEIRDAMLAAAGRLVLSPPKVSPVKDLKVMEMKNDGPEATLVEKQGRASRHRSLYLPLLRSLVPQALEVFDFANQGFVTGHRDTTTVSTQALYLLNDPFVREQSRALAGRLLRQTELDDEARIRSAYRLTLARAATEKEVDRAEAFLSDCEVSLRGSKESRELAWAGFCQAILGSAEFRYVR
ncbi:MAG TPA: PSD1 and planctomycete cytochrome C domain-containing protein [Planctomycetota bacterium]|nr:PSD1 and planctomycete cytochrome C domain-containing protein [Planctomycetota bacterium]